MPPEPPVLLTPAERVKQLAAENCPTPVAPRKRRMFSIATTPIATGRNVFVLRSL